MKNIGRIRNKNDKMKTNKIKWNDYGESSLTLLAVHCNIEKENPCVPKDPSDFKRCIHLFECLGFGKGEIFSLLCIIQNKYSIWKPFINNWDELMKLYNEEKGNKLAPKLYEKIRFCNKARV